MLTQQAIAMEQTKDDVKTAIMDNWSIAPLIFVFAIYKLSQRIKNSNVGVVFLSLSILATTFILAYNPVIRNYNKNMSKWILRIGFGIYVIMLASFFISKKVDNDETTDNLFIEGTNYSFLMVNYIIFLVFNVFLKYSGIKSLEEYNIFSTNELNSKYSFFIFIIIYMMFIFFVNQPTKAKSSLVGGNAYYGFALFVPIIMLLLAYGINIFNNDKDKLVPFIALSIFTFIQIVNSGIAIGYKDNVLDTIESSIETGKNIGAGKTELEKGLEQHKAKINSIQKISSKIPMVFSIISLLIFLVYGIKLESDNSTVVFMIILCFGIYLMFLAGTSKANYLINKNIQNEDNKIKNFFFGMVQNEGNHISALMVSMIFIIGTLGLIGFTSIFKNKNNSKSDIIKFISGFFMLFITALFSHQWGTNTSNFNNLLVVDNVTNSSSMINSVRLIGSLYTDILSEYDTHKTSNSNRILSKGANELMIIPDLSKVVLGKLKFWTNNTVVDKDNKIVKQSGTTNYTLQMYLEDIEDGKVMWRDKNGIKNGQEYLSPSVVTSGDINTPYNTGIKRPFSNKDGKDYDKKTSDTLMSLMADFRAKINDEEKKSFKENIFEKEFNDEKPEIVQDFYIKKSAYIEEILGHLKQGNPNDDSKATEVIIMSSLASNKDDDILEVTIDTNGKKLFYLHLLSEYMVKHNNETIKKYGDSISDFDGDSPIGKLFNYSGVLTVVLLFLSLFLLSNFKMSYDVIGDNFSIFDGRGKQNVFALLFSSLIILLLFVVSIKVESFTKTSLISTESLISSVLNSILIILYLSTLVIPGLVNKIAFYVIILIFHLSLFTLPMDSIENEIGGNAGLIYIILMIVTGVAIYQALSPSRNKYGSLYMMIIMSIILMTLHSSPSMMYLNEKLKMFNEKDSQVYDMEQFRKSANNTWVILVFGLILGGILFKQIMNPYSIKKIDLIQSKNFFFAKDKG
jgi:hypothetical protein